MMTLQDRLAEVFPQPQPRGLQSEIASLCAVKPASVSAWFNLPEKVSSISRTNAEKICKNFNLDVTPAWLAEGVGEKIAQPPVTTPRKIQNEAELIPNSSSIEHLMAGLANYLIEMDDYARDNAADVLRRLAANPKEHARAANLFAAAFQSGKRKAA